MMHLKKEKEKSEHKTLKLQYLPDGCEYWSERAHTQGAGFPMEGGRR